MQEVLLREARRLLEERSPALVNKDDIGGGGGGPNTEEVEEEAEEAESPLGLMALLSVDGAAVPKWSLGPESGISRRFSCKCPVEGAPNILRRLYMIVLRD